MSYSQLSQEERYQIERMLQEGLKVSQIALRLGRHRSTVYRELNRNAGKHYRARTAQRHRRACGQRSSRNAPRYASSTWVPVRRRLTLQWSPQQIAGRAQLQNRPCASWQAIYGWIRRSWPQRHQRPLRRAYRRGSQLQLGAPCKPHCATSRCCTPAPGDRPLGERHHGGYSGLLQTPALGQR